MQLLGQAVSHRAFGDGVITDVAENIVTISFSQGEKRFQYPDAFSRFLTLTDASRQSEVNAVYTRQVRAEKAEQLKQRVQREKQRRLRTMAISPCAQAAFNIEPGEAAALVKTGKLSSGCYLSGASKGQPRVPTRVHPNTCCLLTATPTGKERDRVILGAMMARDDFWGDRCENGTIVCHAKHRLLLPEAVSYWQYFEHGEKYPNWGRASFKYFANETMQKILFDIAQSDLPISEEADAFYRYFTEVNRLRELRTDEPASPFLNA